MARGSKMSAPSTSGLSVGLLLRVIDVKYGCLLLLYYTLNHTKKMFLLCVSRCYLKVFAKMATEIIILHHKVLQRDLLATFGFIKIDFIIKQYGKNSFIASIRKSF